MQKTREQRTREGRWTNIMDAYRRRHRRWVMESMPTMNTREWDLYEEWVTGFGALRLDQASRNSHKMRRQLRDARDKPIVTGLIADAHLNAGMGIKYQRMRFAMGLPARGDGPANRGRATRRK